MWCGITVNSFAVAQIIEQGFNETIAAGSLSVMAFINASSRLAGGAIGEQLEPKKLLISSLIIIILELVANFIYYLCWYRLWHDLSSLKCLTC